MIEWPLIFLGGLLGAGHCVGMCGAFAVTLGVGAMGVRANLIRQALYSMGRTFTYAFGGMLAGAAGMRLARLSTSAFNMQAALAIAAGLLLITQGVSATGILPPIWRARTAAGYCPARGLFASVLTAPGAWNAFFAGLLTGFLPCGLVYAYLALAAGSGSLWRGAAIMALFGAGTIPLMVLTGIGAALLSWRARSNLLRVAACCVIITGLVTVGRGVAWASWRESAESPRCPFCPAASDGGASGASLTAAPPAVSQRSSVSTPVAECERAVEKFNFFPLDGGRLGRGWVRQSTLAPHPDPPPRGGEGE
jgi:sulfite exporter TauE/SafE